jgi:hypothetical protein
MVISWTYVTVTYGGDEISFFGDLRSNIIEIE